MKPSRSSRSSSGTIYQDMVIIPHVKGISEKLEYTGNRFNVRTTFKTKHTLRGTLMETEPARDAQQKQQSVYSITCDCGRYYIGEISRPLEVRIKGHKYNLTQSLLGKSKLAQHVYENGHKIRWNEEKGLQIEPNITYRKHKESAHMSLLDHPICQPSLDISPIWTPVITAEVRKPQLRPVYIMCEICFVMLAPNKEFVSLVKTYTLIVL
jgi:predicted GIY-YIG superfamily endonuclease